MSEQKEQLTRQQRRQIERVKSEAMDVLNRLLAKFYETFMEFEPDGPEVAHKRKEMSAKWKMYCSQHKLNESAFKLCDENMDAIKKKYQEQLAETV